MRDLEDLLRRASHEARPEPPPPRGFAQLRQRMAAASAAPFYAGRWVIVVLLTGIALTVLLRPLERQPSPPGRASVTPSGDTASTHRYGSIPSETTHQPVNNDSAGANVRSSIRSTTSPSPPAVAVTLPPTDSDATVTSAVPKRRPAVGIPRRPPPRRASPLPAAAASGPLDGPPRLLPQPSQRIAFGRSAAWELSLSAYPTWISERYIYFAYADEAPAGQLALNRFVIEGRQQLFYQTRSAEVDQRHFQPIGLLRLSRQTRGGWRYGMGATLFYSRWDYLPAIEENQRLRPSRYVLNFDGETQILLTSLQLGYTFRQEHRLRPWVGLSAQLPIVRWEQAQQTLVDLSSGSQHLQERWRGRDFLLFNFREFPLIPTFEAGAQYRLSSGWSVGANLGIVPSQFAGIEPTVGAEVRYRW